MRISESQLQLVNRQISALRAAKNFYGRKLEDAGITLEDILSVVAYLLSTPSSVPESGSILPGLPLYDQVEAPTYLQRLYERELANWFLLGGFDVQYDKWGL